MTALLAIRTNAKEGQTHSGPRLFVDAQEIPLPAHATARVHEEPSPFGAAKRELRITIPIADLDSVEELTGPMPHPAQVVAFANAAVTMVDAFEDRIPSLERRNSLEVDEAKRAQVGAFIDGMKEAMMRLGVLVAEHLQ